MLAVRDLGLAQSFAAALAAEYGEAYSAVAEALAAKLAKARARKARGRKSGNRRTSE